MLVFLSSGRFLVHFTFTERYIAGMLSKGSDAADIAREMNLAVATINKHLRACMAKAGLQHRGQLIIYVIQNPRVLVEGGRAEAGLLPRAA